MMNIVLLFFRYATQKLLHSWSFWIFLFSVVCSFVSVFYLLNNSPEGSSYTYLLMTILSNISYSYVAGYIFYIVSDFLHNTKDECEALNTIAYAEIEILSKKPYLDLNLLSKANIELNEITCDYIPREVNFESEYEIFKFTFCEKNPYEKFDDIRFKLLTKQTINESYVSHSKNIFRNCISNFDLLTGSLSRFLSYEEILSLAKLKRFYNLDFAMYEEGKLCVHQYEIDVAFAEYFDSLRIITNSLKERASFCVPELKQRIMELDTYAEIKENKYL